MMVTMFVGMLSCTATSELLSALLIQGMSSQYSRC